MSEQGAPEPAEDRGITKDRPQRWLFMLGVWFVIIAGIFGTAELAVRAFFHPPVSPYDMMTLLHSRVGFRSFNEIFEYDATRFWKVRPELHGLHIVGDLFERHIDFSVNTDAQGMRVMAPSACAGKTGTIRVLALGDSCTFGFGVNDDDAWPAQLERRLNANADGRCFEVLNAGVPAYSSYQCLQYLRDEGLALKPNVVIAQFWINDHMPWRFGDYRIAARLHPPAWQIWLSKSRLFEALRFAAPAWMAPERPRLLPDEFIHTVTEFVELCRRSEIPVVLAIWPSEKSWQEGALEPYPAALEQFARDHGVPFVNALPSIYQKPGPWFVDVYHGSSEGNAVMANLLEPEIRRICK